MRVYHLLLPVLALAGSAAATFVMCVEPKGVSNGTKVDLDVNRRADNVKGCAIFCQGEDAYDWSFFGNHGECVCGHTAPDAAYEAKARRKGTNNTCPANTYEADYLDTNYNFNFCYDTLSFHLSLPLVTTDLTECFTYCAGMGDKYMAILGTPQSSPPNMSCICGPNDSAQVVNLGHRVPCAKNASAYYELGASPSLSAKRIMRIMAAEKRRLTSVCPETFEACMVPGSDSFECIDPMEELESCGGCVDGHFEDTTRTPSGIDCTTLRGVSPGHVMCQHGTCVVSECEVGYRLVDAEHGGACVPALRQQDKRPWPWHPTGERAATVVMPHAPAPRITRVPVAVESKSESVAAEVKRLGKVVWVSGGSLFKSRAWWPWGEEQKKKQPRVAHDKEQWTETHQRALLSAITAHLLASRRELYATPALSGVADHGGERINKKIKAALKRMCGPEHAGLVEEEMNKLTAARRAGGGGGGGTGSSGSSAGGSASAGKRKRVKTEDEDSG